MAIPNSTNSAPALSFSREIFAALQPRQYLLAHLSPPSKSQTPIRPNGRQPTEFRKPSVNTNSLTHCNGSAVVRLGDTSVVCGVRGEILLASDLANPPTVSDSSDEHEDEVAELNLLVPNVELATGSNPAHIPGQAPSGLAQSLASRLVQTLSTTRLVPAQDLRIWYQPPMEQEMDVEPERQVKAYWTLYIDVLYMSLDGAAFDAAWLAILAALQSTRLPKAWWDADMEAILCSDIVAESSCLSLRGFPVSATFAVFSESQEFTEEQEKGKAWVLADPDDFEEGYCRETARVVADAAEGSPITIRAIEKRGGGYVGLEEMKTVLEHAGKRWHECREIIGPKGS